MLAIFCLFGIPLTGDMRAYAVEGENCGCHSSKADMQFVHKPVKEGHCYQCHKPTDQKHPRFKKEAFNLSDNGKSRLCYECHEKKNNMKFVHTPVASGDC